MLHHTLVIRSPLSYISPRYSPGKHRLRLRVTFMLEEYQAVIATIIRSPGASSDWLAFAIFAKSWDKCEAGMFSGCSPFLLALHLNASVRPGFHHGL